MLATLLGSYGCAGLGAQRGALARELDGRPDGVRLTLIDGRRLALAQPILRNDSVVGTLVVDDASQVTRGGAPVAEIIAWEVQSGTGSVVAKTALSALFVGGFLFLMVELIGGMFSFE